MEELRCYRDIDAFAFSKFKTTNNFFFVFVFLKHAAIQSADTNQERTKTVRNGLKNLKWW